MEGIGREHDLEIAMELVDVFFNKHPRLRKPPRKNAQAKPRITGLPSSQQPPSSLEGDASQETRECCVISCCDFN
jgi:hypothetical protein